MNKKKIIILISSVLILVVILFFLTKYLILVFKVNELNKEFSLCKKKFYEVENYYSAEKCFAKIISETGKIEYRYYRALAFFNMMEFNKAKLELKQIIQNEDKIKNKKLIEKSKNIYEFLNSASEKELIHFVKYNDVEELFQVLEQRQAARAKAVSGIVPQYNEMSTSIRNVSYKFYL